MRYAVAALPFFFASCLALAEQEPLEVITCSEGEVTFRQLDSEYWEITVQGMRPQRGKYMEYGVKRVWTYVVNKKHQWTIEPNHPFGGTAMFYDFTDVPDDESTTPELSSYRCESNLH
jgi:hypothetical protein